MKIPYSTIISLAALGLISCKNGAQNEVAQRVESDSITMVKSSHPITDMLFAEFDSADVYNDSIIKGYWFKPHEACYVNVFFHKDNTFEYKYYTVDNDDETEEHIMKGTYSIDGEEIRMVADDGWNGKEFDGIMYHKSNGTNYYLTDKSGDLYLVKGSD